MIIRPGTYDESMIRDGRKSYRKLGIEPGDLVVDLGAHVGGFSVWAVEQGAGRVVAYEPEQSNLALLRKHTAGMPVEIQPVAVMPDTGVATLYRSTGPHTGHHSMVIQHASREPVAVQAVAFADVMALRPARIKIDVEGAEHSYDYDLIPDSVRGIGMEFEMQNVRWQASAHAIWDALAGMGFRVVKQPKGTSHTTGVWVR